MTDTEKHASRVVLAALVLTGLITGAMAFRQIFREARAIGKPPQPPAATSAPAPAVIGTLPDFNLTKQDGAPVATGDLAGKVWIADFIFTRCAGPCPRMTQRMADLQGQLSGAPEVRFVSFSVDPEYDTPEVLTRYAEQFGADTNTWSFLTGNRDTIYDLSIKGFKLAVDDDTDYDHLIIHSTRFVLVDQNSRIRGYYDEDDEEAMTRLVAETRRLAGTSSPQ